MSTRSKACALLARNYPGSVFGVARNYPGSVCGLWFVVCGLWFVVCVGFWEEGGRGVVIIFSSESGSWRVIGVDDHDMYRKLLE